MRAGLATISFIRTSTSLSTSHILKSDRPSLPSSVDVLPESHLNGSEKRYFQSTLTRRSATNSFERKRV
eukprot:3119132-Prymnesium_polylepis.1